MSRGWVAIVLALAVLAVMGCGSDDDAAGPEMGDGVRVAAFDFAESELLAELYAQVLEGGDVPVVRLGAIGPREVVAPALEAGRIDLVPEYLGTASGHFGAATADVDGLAAAVSPRGLVVLEPALAEDVNAFVVTLDTALARDLTRLSDLEPVASTMRFGGPVECPDRPLCLIGLGEVYGLSFAEFVPHRSLAATAEALLRGEVDIGLMFSSAAELTSGPFVVLDDDRQLQPPENVVPILRRDATQRWGPDLTVALESLSATLTTDALQSMNRQVKEGVATAQVAASWLAGEGLVG